MIRGEDVSEAIVNFLYRMLQREHDHHNSSSDNDNNNSSNDNNNNNNNKTTTCDNDNNTSDNNSMFRRILELFSGTGPQLRNCTATTNMDNHVHAVSYELFLDPFGNGSENRAANTAAINSLPTSTINDV